MKIALFDKGGGEFYDNAYPAGVKVFGNDSIVRFLPPSNQIVTEGFDGFTHIICHVNSEGAGQPEWDTLLGNLPESVQVIIRVSSVGINGQKPTRLSQNGPWAFYLPKRSGDFEQGVWENVFLELQKWDASSGALSPELATIFASDSDIEQSYFAFRLLCEAYLLCDGKPSSKVHGITIHAPTAPKDWLAPFGINPEDENAINQLAGMIGTGEIKTKVKDVLQAVTEEDNNLKSAIEAFLNATSEPSTLL